MELFRIFGTVAVKNSEANNALDETTQKAEGSQSKMVSAFKKIGAAVATYFAVDKIAGFGKEIVNLSAEVSAEASAFEQIMGDYSEEAAKKVGKIAEATGMVNTRLTPYMTSMTAKFKGLGYDIDEATNLASDGLNLAADAAAFWDKTLDDSMSALNSFINGSYEGGEAIGLFANDTQLASYAVKNGIVSETKEWASLDEARKQATRLEYAQAMFAMSGATGQAAKESDQYANVQANLTEKWRQFKAEIGEPLLQNIVLPAMDKLSDVVDKASEGYEKLKKWIVDNKDELKQAAETVSELAEIAAYATGVFISFKAAMALQKTVQGIQSAKIALSMLSLEIGGANLAQAALNGTLTIGETIVGLLTGKIKLAAVAQGLMTKAQGALNAVLSANPIAIVITAIAALVAAFIYLWNNCEGFRNFWINLWDGVKAVAKSVADWFVQAWTDIGDFFTKTVPAWFESFKTKATNVFNAVKLAITSPIESAKNKVKSVVDAIKGFFNFKVQLPKVKLPHFSISPKGWQLGDLLKGSIPKLGIEWYAKGGVFDKPTLFSTASGMKGVGESGAEAVAPIDVLQGYVADAVASQNEKLVGILREILNAILAVDSNMGGNLRDALDGTSLSVNNREFARLVRGVT